jgi:diguanylate cyclase (GGDEF)-like protein
VGACALLAGAFLVVLLLRPGGDHTTRTVDDLAELAAAAAAAVAGVWRGRGRRGRARTSWLLIAAGCAAWALGEALWCYYELLAGRDQPFPSWADAGFLLFPVLTLVGLMVRPSSGFTGQGRARVAVDAVLVAGSLFIVSWVSALGEVYRVGADSTFAAAVSLAYPGTDIMLLTVALVATTFGRAGNRAGLISIVIGTFFLTVGDSGFAYLTAAGTYGEVNFVDAGWVTGFLVLALAACVDTQPPGGDDAATLRPTPRLALLLPYIPVTVAVGVVLNLLVTGRPDAVSAAATSAVIAALVGRQMLVLLENRSLMARVAHQAFHDELTGLANRALFNDRLGHALDLHRRDLRPVTVLLIDLDDFKTVNDSLGHPAGDELLERVAERLRAVSRTGDTVARLGGDEFAVLMEDGGQPVDAAARVLGSFDQPVLLGGRAVPVGVSLGVATLRPDDSPASAVDMLKRADLAMYAAKRGGKSAVRLYSPDLEGGESAQLDLRAAFTADLQAGRIDVAFQPIRRADGALDGFEALARWNHEGSPVSPATFLPMARRLGCLHDVDRLVITTAVREAARWHDGLVLSVNVDGETLTDPEFASFVLDVLDGRLSPSRLAVEVLENTLVEEDELSLDTLRRLRAAGVRIVVDDFGAGYASLVRLQTLRPDVVKIDRSLVAGLTDPTPTPLLTGVAELAHQIGADVVAEGVETTAQLQAAIAAGCDAVQGFLLGRPTSADGCRHLLSTDPQAQRHPSGRQLLG